MNLGKAIKLIRTQRALSQSDLAELTGLSVSYLSLIERNKRDPTLSTICNIASKLYIPVSLLMFLADEGEADKIIGKKLATMLAYATLQIINT